MEVSGAALGAYFLGILVFVIVMINGYRYVLKQRFNHNLKEKHAGGFSSPLKGRAKYPDVDSFKNTGLFFRFGLALALLMTLLAMSWTQYETAVYIPDDAMLLDEDIEIEPPRTAEPPPPPPPPPPPVIEEVPEEEILEEDEEEFMDMTVEEETEIVEEKYVEAPPPPPPPPPEPEVEEIFKVVEQMPRFPGCDNEGGSNEEKYACAQKKLLEYVYKNVKYPAIARENGIQGGVVVQFVVEKDGSISDIRIARDIGAGCGEESLRVVQSMNNMPQKWTPGKQRGKAVRVQFTLPIKFKLQ
jgi:TonB family protein